MRVKLLFFFLLSSMIVTAQENDSLITRQKHRTKIAITAVSAAYVASMGGLYQLWYTDNPSTQFHLFNDNYEWRHIDKFGHAASAYYLSRWGNNIVSWTGASSKRSVLIGTGISYLFFTTIEVFDAFSTKWGFSVPDMLANTSGCALFLGQQLLWNEQRIQMKFSYIPSEFAKYRPDALGKTPVERLFKDYNAQTYWMSFNIYSFLNKNSKFPKWLNIAAGYGATGMVTAADQIYQIDQVIFYEQERLNEYYISPDIDLTQINWHSKFMKAFSKTIGFIKFPLPAIKWKEGRHPEFKKFGF